MKRIFETFGFLVGIFCAIPLVAWESHSLPTSIAISQMPEIANAPKVSAETLESFLRAEQGGLAKLLADEESWARKNVPYYPSRPASLDFDVNAHVPDLMTRFLGALRVNPGLKFNLYVQEMPGKAIPNAHYISTSDVTLLPNSLSPTGRYFIGLSAGELVAPADIFATASDEPDYGLDINLWSSSGTPYGKAYHFGNQPFGNPKLEFASQAPFHMAFYHEAKPLTWAVQFLSWRLPEYRMHLFRSLSRFAFKTGHPYWGWRFAGMGAHYIQDLTQPYHTTMVPGESTAELLLYGMLDKIGFHGPKDKLVQQASDQHLAIENQVYCTTFWALQNHDEAMPLVKALKNSSQDRRWIYSSAYVKNVLTKESNGFADDVVVAMKQILPASHSKAVVYAQDDSDPSGCSAVAVSANTERLLTTLMDNFGKHTRTWIRSVLSTRQP